MPQYPTIDTIARTYSAIFAVDAAQRIVYWNEGARRVLGYSKDDVLGRACHRVIRGICGGSVWCRSRCRVNRDARDGKLPRDFSLLTHDRSGADVWLRVCILLLRNSGDWLIVHLLHDISDQQRKETTLDSLVRLLSSCLPVTPCVRESRTKGGSGCTLCVNERLATLSPREIEVLTLLSGGLSTAGMADRLCISPATVRRHVENILRKTSLHSRAEAMAFAYRCGLFSSVT